MKAPATIAACCLFAAPSFLAAAPAAEPTELDPITVIGTPWVPPKPVLQLRPAFPMASRHRWEEGCVVLRYTVREDGRTDDFAVIESNPPRVFEKAVISAVYRWRFEPSDEAQVLVEKFEFRNPRLGASPVSSVHSYQVAIDDSGGRTPAKPMITTQGYRAPRCELWDRTHDRHDHGPEPAVVQDAGGKASG